MTMPVCRGAKPAQTASPPPRGAGAIAPPTAAEQLRALARRVRRLGLAGRFDPEAAFIERDELAHALHRLADGLERGAGQPSAGGATSRSRAVSPRRIAAVLAAKTSEIASLRALLAQAVRPARPRQRVTSKAQLTLPLLETTDEG